jgi:DNA-binding transcriptional LysR family regulator
LVLPEVLAISDMIAVVPQRMAENRVDMFVCDTPVPVAGFTKSMAWHGRTHRNPAQVWLRELLLETSGRA